MFTSLRSLRVLTTIAALLMAYAALPATTVAQSDDPGAACEQGGWETLAPAEDPSAAFASQDACVSYIAAGNVPVAFETPPAAPEQDEPGDESATGDDGSGDSEAPPDADIPTNDDDVQECLEGRWGELASAETPTVPFERPDDCIAYAVQGGSLVPVQLVEAPEDADTEPGSNDVSPECQRNDWDDLAPIETPLVPFESQGDCARYTAGGGDAVDAITFDVASAHDDCAAAQAYVPDADTDLSDLHLYGCDLSGHDLSGAYLNGAILIDAELANANLSGTSLQNADLRYADLTGTDLSGADLGQANLSGADLTGADLSNLSNTGLWKANLSRANLTGANLSGDFLQDADVSGATLRNANLSGADLSGTDFTAANLTGANLTNANLSRARLIYATLTGATLDGANFLLATCPDGAEASIGVDSGTNALSGSCDGHLDGLGG